MPPIGKLLGGVDFSNLFVILGGGGPFPSLKAAQDAGVATLNYGIFINALINFAIIAFALFMVVKAMNQDEARGSDGATAADQQALPAVPDGDSDQGREVRPLHQHRVGCVRGGRRRPPQHHPGR